MSDFVIGELVIMQNATYFHRWDGALGVVIGLREKRRAIDLNTNETAVIDAYRVRILEDDGIALICERHQMKRLPMPQIEFEDDETIERERTEPEGVE